MSNDNNNELVESSTSIEEEYIILNDETIKEYCSNEQIIKFIKKRFNRLSRVGAINLLNFLLNKHNVIHGRELVKKYKSFCRYNLSSFNKDNTLKLEVIKSLQRELNGYLHEIGKGLIEYDGEEQKEYDIKVIDGERVFIVNKHTRYKEVRQLICDEADILFKYNFKKADLEISIPESTDNLQLVKIQILSKAIKFDYPLEYEYLCGQCYNKNRRKAYEVVSTNTKLLCPGIFHYLDGNGESKSRLCKMSLYPDKEISLIKDGYYYDMSYEDEDGNKQSTSSFSFNKYLPGFYDAVVFRIKNPKKTEIYQIIDVKEIQNNKFKLPDKKEDENYIYTLQKSTDKFIKKQTGVEIYGMYPIKCALIVQKAASHLNILLRYNVQCIGSASAGKSITLKYYGYLLNNNFHLSSNGLSISVAGLRGTKVAINLLGSEINVITTGYLGTYKSIHIDEAGENKELVQNLKTFLYDLNYSYNKAGADGSFHRRTAHCNLSENLDYTHLGIYRGTIRKAYKEMENIRIGEDEQEKWNEDWDLHLPLFKYDNPYLYKVVKDERTKLILSQKFWIDGYDYALHERFPFYFYLVVSKKDEKLNDVIKGNVIRNTISENMEVMRALKNEELNQFFDTLKEYVVVENEQDALDGVDDIIKEYGLELDSRQKEFYFELLKISRIINKRTTFKKEDYDFIRYIIEKTNCKLDISDTADYKIEGAPDLIKNKKAEELIEEQTKKAVEDGISFGIPNEDKKTFGL